MMNIICIHDTVYDILGGGKFLKYFWNFHPECLGKMISNLTVAYFSNGLKLNHQPDYYFFKEFLMGLKLLSGLFLDKKVVLVGNYE